MDRELFEAARAVRDRAHAPYSRLSVSAALRTETGSIHAGCNVENASFPEGWCAETSAIAAMIATEASEPARRIASICIVAEPIDGRLVTPCGGCRQRIAEFGHPDTLIYVSDPDGNSRSYSLRDLLPAAFALEPGT
jgi:cytidine deaminase